MENLFFNRELSWLKFNERVLGEATAPETPLFERLRFCSIFASNLDEFYMVRMGSLHDQTLLSGMGIDNKTGMTAKEQIDAVNSAAHALYPARDAAYRAAMAGLAGTPACQVSVKSLDGGYRRIVKDYFEREVLPLLSPQVIDAKHPFPHLENKMIYVAVRLKSKGSDLFGILPMPPAVDRIYPVPGADCVVLLEDILFKYADDVFGVYKVQSKALFRVTRSADIDVSEGLLDEDTDYRSYMSEIVKKRSRLSPVRLETSDMGDPTLLGFVLASLGLTADECFLCQTPLDLSFAGKLEELLGAKDREKMLYTPARPQWPGSLAHGRIIPQILEHDVLLAYPYESMRPFTDLLHEASEDKNVVSVKITLYRVGQQSQIIQSLCAAAENGKDVTVLIELRARFDEQTNIHWSTLLEEAGCRVIYGVGDYKVHSKITLITRKADRRIQYITHIGTGNYNEGTARLYSDLNLLTADPEIGEDAVEFFQNMTISNVEGTYRRLLVSPASLKESMLALIRGEEQKAKEGRSARIVAKMNSLTDKEVIEELAAASQAGVKIDLIIRGICCLRPGLPGLTENITVRSIVGRYLEHARIYSFGEGEERALYISSADMMTRNTTRRVEIAAPILDRALAQEICGMLDAMLRDNVKARVIGPDGIYRPVENGGDRLDSQMYFYDLAVKRSAAGLKNGRPLELGRREPLLMRLRGRFHRP